MRKMRHRRNPTAAQPITAHDREVRTRVKPNRVLVAIRQPFGQLDLMFNFSRAGDAWEFSLNAIESENVIGVSLFLKNKFAGARDGKGG